MKIIFKVLFSIFILFCGNLAIYGCICPYLPLGRTFKEAKAVFIGKLAENNLSSQTQIQGAKGAIVVEVEKSWKGVKGNYFSVTPKFEDLGMCTLFFKKFDKGEKYLIFVEGENYEVRNYCTYSEEIYSASKHPEWYKEDQRKIIQRLNRYENFWFRLGKRLLNLI